MSFILDALKKSETDRQRQAHPETAHVPVAGRDRGPGRWVWVVGLLLAANMLALGYVLLRPGTSPPSVAVSPPDIAAPGAAVVPEAALPQTPASPVQEPAAASRDARPEPAVARPDSSRPLTEPDLQARVPAESTPPPPRQAVVASDEPPAAEFMTFSEARVAGMQLDDLALELHVFSSAPAERFVFINMGKYREGETLSEGPRVREIRPDGVLLEYSETLFLLPRE